MKILIITILFALTYNLNAKLERVIINPKNRVNLYFNTIPTYKSELKRDKKNVFLYLEDSEFVNRYSQVSGTGIVRFVTVTLVDKKVKVQIEFTTNRGYTAIPLPFSNSIIVEGFSWENIDKEEDTYREALLALESGSTEQAKELLITIADGKIADAKAILGLLQLKDGNIIEGAKHLFEANRDSSTIEDIYAGLAEIFKWKGFTEDANKNDSIFRSITKLAGYPSYAYSGNPEDLLIPEYYYSNQQTNNKEGLDTTISDEKSSNTFLADSEGKSVSELLGFSDGYVIFTIIILLLSAFMLYYVYNKWKKSKIQEFKNMSSNMFQEEIRQARMKQKYKIEDQQRINEDLGITKKETDEKPNILKKKYGQNPITPKKENIQQFKVKATKNVKEITNKEQLEKFLTNFIPLKRIEEDEKKVEAQAKEKEYDSDKEIKIETNSPDVNLALRLAEEKNRIKQKQLIDIANQKRKNEIESNSNDKQELTEESSSDINDNIENNLNNISDNNELLSKLNKKFNVDNSKDNE